MAGKHGKANSERKRGRGAVSWLLLIVGIGLIAASVFLFGSKTYEYYEGDKTYEKTSHNTSSDVDWDALRAINPEVVGWIEIPDTNINYPVAQHEDNDFYLTHTFDLTENILGCIFLDCDSKADLTDFNSMFYGHHMRNGSMFHDLKDYVDQDFYENHKYVYYSTPEYGRKKLKVISVVVAAGDEKLCQTEFASDAELQKYATELIGRSEVTTEGYSVKDITHLYMLLTCSYQFDNARTVLVAVEVDKDGKQIPGTPHAMGNVTSDVTTPEGQSVPGPAQAS